MAFLLIALFALQPAAAQQVQLSVSVTLDEADGVVRGRLERIKVLIANARWDEAIETLRQVADQWGDKVTAVGPGYYVRIRDYCHRTLASLPPEALAIYRGQVDVQAKQWFDEAVTAGDDRPLRLVVDQLYASSYGDEALALLGERALERGDHGAARAYWEQLLESPPRTIASEAFLQVRADPTLAKEDLALLDRYYEPWEERRIHVLHLERSIDPELGHLARLLRLRGIVSPRLAYPGPDVPPADVLARLLLVLILEGSSEQAEAGIREFAAVYPEAQGRLGGREVRYTEALEALLAESQAWPRGETTPDWPTFAGNAARNRAAAQAFDLGRVRWRAPLPSTSMGESDLPRRVGEGRQSPLSYHPIVVDDVVFVNNATQIYAFDLHTGRPAWGGDQAVIWRPDDLTIDRSYGTRMIGVPRFTLTAHNHRLLARMGDPVTSSPSEAETRFSSGYIVCLDLASQGSLLWTARPPEGRWSFEGTPVADDDCVYVAMRKGGVRSQMHVACLDGDTGELRWRRFICSAETAGQGQSDEITHTLLTLTGENLYLNTNLGAVAALSKSDGETRWVALYPRTLERSFNRRSSHFARDLTPCVYDRGTLYVAPSDSRHILALDASCGLLQWETTLAEDAVHLLGVRNDQLFAAGDGFWRIDCGPRAGKILQEPAAGAARGNGRGLLVGDLVLQPVQARVGSALEVYSATDPAYYREIELSTRNADGGNLVSAGDYLLIASGKELIALDRYGGLPPAAPDAEEPAASSTLPADAEATTAARTAPLTTPPPPRGPRLP